MKPRNNKQKHILELSEGLPSLTPKQKEWALSNTISHYAYRLKNGKAVCMKCGHEWEAEEGLCRCPNCRQYLEVKTTTQRVIRDKAYFNIITTKGGYQIVRMFLMMVEMRKGMKAKPAFLEIGSYWIDDKGRATVVGLARTMGMYVDCFAFGSPLEIRHDNDAFRHIAGEWIYPRVKVIPTLKRNGFKGSTHYIHPIDLFTQLLTNPKAETLMKANQIELLRYLCNHQQEIDRYWSSIKIAIRHNYKVNDSMMYMDYIRMLDRCGKDLNSPKYVCPDNLQEAHDHYVRKTHELDARAKRAEDIEKAKQREEGFRQMKEKFFGIRFADNEIEVKVLESVEEYRQEAEIMHICLFSASYDQRENSLIFSARISGKIIETVEVDLRTLQVVQSRAVCNGISEYHDRIVSLVNANAHLIKERMTA